MKRGTETILVEVGGQIYHGARIVTGEHDLRQEIRYEELRQRDPNDYNHGDKASMRAMAEVILRDLVELWEAQGVRSPVKVEPKGRTRRRRSEGDS
jgi:hypothetical protein